MRKETATKVANLLAAVALTLRQGRPRMRPGCGWRPEAINAYGRTCRPTHHKARRWSLVGALKVEAAAFGYSRRIRELAMWAILDAEADGYNGGDQYSFEALDGGVYDTRAIIRRVQKAQRQLERELVAA